MGKGGSSEIKETDAQKALAEVANKQWALYQDELRPYEDMFIDKVEGLNDEKQFQGSAGTAALGNQSAFGQSREALAGNLAASGMDPTSGKYQSAMASLETDQALSQTDTANRAQSSQQDKYVAGLKDVVSIGQGQKAEALAGIGDVAGSSLGKATADAQISFQNRQATAGLVGSLAGAGTAYGLGQKGYTEQSFAVDADAIEKRGAFTGSSSLALLSK